MGEYPWIPMPAMVAEFGTEQTPAGTISFNVTWWSNNIGGIAWFDSGEPSQRALDRWADDGGQQP